MANVYKNAMHVKCLQNALKVGIFPFVDTKLWLKLLHVNRLWINLT
jgi:hypothetical protein